jgi:LDH2 family malate/lactate/ureidoglycolate dehydrogenase
LRLSLPEARRLCRAALRNLGYGAEDIAILTDYFIETSLRGVPSSGLDRITEFAAYVRARGARSGPIRMVRQTAVSAVIDGGDNHGYLVAARAAALAVTKARSKGFAVVGAHNTQITGNFAHYIEKATRAGLIGFAAGSSRAAVAPHGATAPLLGTNPLAFGFPARGEPIIWDVTTAALSHGTLRKMAEQGEPLEPGTAYDAAGNETRDAAAALKGALRAWGGHRGSGLAVVAQLLGILAGAPVLVDGPRNFGFFFLAFKPDLLMPAVAFKRRAAELAARVRQSGGKSSRKGAQPRLPFERSAATRRERQKNGIPIDDDLHAAIVALAETPKGAARVRRRGA